MQKPLRAAAAVAMFAIGLTATAAQPLRLGTIEFTTSGTPAAQRNVAEGIALLHSFIYDAAAERFKAAEAEDPALALAYWFDALTYSHSVWGDEDVAAGRAVLARLGPDREARLAKAATARERAWGEAIETLFADGSPVARSSGFVAGMKHVMAVAPDTEATAFTSLAILGAARLMPPAQQDAAFDEAESLAVRILTGQHDHPGAAHYIIHADDTPARATRALEAARAYASIAPDAVHALHMPAHTFVQLGLWDEAAHATEHAWAVSRAQVTARHQSTAELSFHDLLWIVYVDAQQGRYADARRMAEEGRDALAAADLSHATVEKRYGGCFAAAAYVQETGDWPAWRALTGKDASVAAAPTATGATPLERNVIGTCEYDAALSEAMLGNAAPAMAVAARYRQTAARTEGRGNGVATARAALLEGLLARNAGDHQTAINRFREAADAEALRIPLGPQSMPALEQLGSELLATKRGAEAAAAYEAELARSQNRSIALLGLARAAKEMGDQAKARDAYQRLVVNWHAADAELRRQLQ